MKTKKTYVCFALIFIGIATAATVFAYPGSSGNADQADEHENAPKIADNSIESSSSVISKVKPSNPLAILSAGATGTDSATELTVYNNDLALVKERRELDLKAGVNNIEYSDVAALIDPTSVMFEDTKNKNTAVLEQNYEYDLVSSDKLLDKFLGKEITASEKEGNTYTGTLLSHDGGVVLKLSDGKVVSLAEVTKFEFPDSAGLLTKPTLVWQVYSPVTGSRNVLTSYLTGGMKWNANYIVKTNTDDTKADIQGWVSIDNKAGASYNDAKLKLVAGEVHRITPPEPPRYEGGVLEETADIKGEGGFVEEALFEYHLYTLERPATLKNNQVKQLSLLSADSVPVEKELVFDASKSNKVQVALNLNNSKEKGLGMPLPAGVLRVYKADSEGQLQFLGEDSIDHTPKDEEIKVVIGNAFDLTGTRAQTDYKRVNNNVWRESYDIELKNHKSETQKIKVVEHFYGDWKIITSSDTYEKKDAYTAEWEVSVAANGSKKVSFTVERRY
ncbi:MAG: DUF4139 domain-containing protein [Euryarchaeota archaeon]|nr:DUF4139 domain-containing protein [Euryarchaeota archaeon]